MCRVRVWGLMVDVGRLGVVCLPVSRPSTMSHLASITCVTHGLGHSSLTPFVSHERSEWNECSECGEG